MGTFHLTYNPYRVKTTLSVLNGTEWIDIGKESKLNWIENRRMQFWLQAHEDMADFERAALQCTDQDSLVVSVVLFCGEKDFLIWFKRRTCQRLRS